MKLSTFANYCDEIGTDRKTSRKQAVLEGLFEEETAESAELFIRILLNDDELFDDPEKKTGVGSLTVYNAVSEYFDIPRSELEGKEVELGKPSDAVAAVFEAYGGNGDTSLDSFVESSETTLSELYSSIEDLVTASGNNEREAILRGIYTDVSAIEARWITYALLGDLSLYCGDGIVKKALASQYSTTRGDIDRGHSLLGTVAEVASVLAVGVDLPEHADPGLPFSPMLADDVNDGEELPSGDEWVAQPKFDGARILIHWDGEEVRFFTRNMKEVTESLPELHESLDPNPEVPFIVDGEAVAFEPLSGEMLPYEKAMTRFRREHDIKEAREGVEIRVHLFDIVWLGSERIDNIPFDARHQMLQRFFCDTVRGESGTNGDFSSRHFSVAEIFHDTDQAYEQALQDGFEGVILKDMSADYDFTPPGGNRPEAWVKVKPTSTIEARASGFEKGTGKYAGQLGALQLETSDGVPIGNVGIGFSDKEREELTEEDCVGSIVEIKAEDLQETDDGYGLRFPRFERLRDESDAKVDSLERMLEILR